MTRKVGVKAPLAVGVFSNIGAHSPREGVIAGAAQARRASADLLVALGGGSVIDATKVMQLVLWAGIRRAKSGSASFSKPASR